MIEQMSLPYRSPFYGDLWPRRVDRAHYVRKIEMPGEIHCLEYGAVFRIDHQDTILYTEPYSSVRMFQPRSPTPTACTVCRTVLSPTNTSTTSPSVWRTHTIPCKL